MPGDGQREQSETFPTWVPEHRSAFSRALQLRLPERSKEQSDIGYCADSGKRLFRDSSLLHAQDSATAQQCCSSHWFSRLKTLTGTRASAGPPEVASSVNITMQSVSAVQLHCAWCYRHSQQPGSRLHLAKFAAPLDTVSVLMGKGEVVMRGISANQDILQLLYMSAALTEYCCCNQASRKMRTFCLIFSFPQAHVCRASGQTATEGEKFDQYFYAAMSGARPVTKFCMIQAIPHLFIPSVPVGTTL